MRILEVKIRQFFWAIKQCFKPKPYDFVIYKSKEYLIKPSMTGYNIWDLYYEIDEEPTHKYIKGSDFKLNNNHRRCMVVFKNSMKFQKRNWESIDYLRPIGRRLAFRNSDNIKF